MNQLPPQSTLARPDAAKALLGQEGHEYQALWFAVAKLPWNSLVLVPADEGCSVAHVAQALAAIGDHLSVSPVTYMVAHPSDYKSAIQVAAGASSRGWSSDQRALPRSGRVIIAVEPVVVEPFGIAVCQEADATVICVELGTSGLAATRKTLERIGRDHVAGCFLVG